MDWKRAESIKETIKKDEAKLAKTEDFINTYSEIRQLMLICLQSFKGNWILDSFDYKRRDKVVYYVYLHYHHKYSITELYAVFYELLENELAQIDVKPYGEQ